MPRNAHGTGTQSSMRAVRPVMSVTERTWIMRHNDGEYEFQERDMPSTESQQAAVPFSPSDVDRIRESMLSLGARIACPQCDRELTSDPIAGGGSIETVWEVRCVPCARSLVISGLL